jgi:hypothetical protein
MLHIADAITSGKSGEIPTRFPLTTPFFDESTRGHRQILATPLIMTALFRAEGNFATKKAAKF